MSYKNKFLNLEDLCKYDNRSLQKQIFKIHDEYNCDQNKEYLLLHYDNDINKKSYKFYKNNEHNILLD